MLANNDWYLDPERFVDAEDIEKLGRGAINLLRDMVVSRSSELNTLRNLFKKALKQPVHLLPSQLETMRLADEAKIRNITASTFIAQELGIHRSVADRRLKTLNNRLMVINYQNDTKTTTYEDKNSIYNEQPKIELDARDKENIAVGLTFDCPTQPFTQENFKSVECKGTASGRFGICYACSQVYGKNKSERAARGYEWVNDLVKLARDEAVNDAKHMLFDRDYGTNIDVSEL